MPNGKPGDHPYTDIVAHRRDVYSKRAAALVREIASLVDDKKKNELAQLLFYRYNEFEKPNIAELERVLEQLRDEAKREAEARGFE